METAGTIVFASLMATVSLQLIVSFFLNKTLLIDGRIQ
jgi:hypothetical protein